MKKTKLYYHILEHGSYGNIGYQGYRESKEEAEAEIKRLSDYFPDLHYEIFVDTSKKEPPITTV